MELLIACLILFGIALLIPVSSKIYRETMWRYIKEKLEFEREYEDLKRKYLKK